MNIEKNSLPTGWRWASLGEVLVQRNDIVHPKDGPVGTARFVGLEHIESHTGRRLGETFVHLEKMSGRRARFRARDIVYGYLRPYLNKVWIAEFDGLCSVDQYVYSVNPDVADTGFVAAYLRSGNYLSLAPIKETPGQLPRIRTDEVATTPIPLPGIGEQRRIVAALDECRAALEATRAKAREVVTLCEDLRWTLTREAFPTNSVAAQARGWPWARLRTIIESTKNGLYTPENNYGSGTPIIKMFNIGRFTGRFELQRLDRISLDDNKLTPFRLEPGDIVVNRVNSAELVAKSALVTEREAGSVFESKNIRLRVRRAVADPSYVCAALNNEFTRRQIFDGRKQIIGMATIDRETLDNIEIAVPRLEEQVSIMNRLQRDNSALDAARIGASAQIAELSGLEPALLRAAFSGVL